MRILALETSCDETAAALLEMQGPGVGSVLAEVISSQVALHAAYGGVVPELAAREHLSALPLVVDKVLQQSGGTLDTVDALVVTQGPGLKGCLLMGMGFARALALARGLPILGVNHIEGHVLVPLLDNPELKPPYLALVVSGGHTEIVLVREPGEYELMARTLDDAAGEAFDKSANLLGLPYPGGPRLATLADQFAARGEPSPFTLPRVALAEPVFSFSGLKTAISLAVKRSREALATDETLQGALAFTIQEAIVDALAIKVKQAVERSGIDRVAVTGGVSANRRLRARLAEDGYRVFAPTLPHCTDNAAMIGWAGAYRLFRGDGGHGLGDVRSRWPIETIGVTP